MRRENKMSKNATSDGEIKKRLLIKVIDATKQDLANALKEMRKRIIELQKEELIGIGKIQQLHELKQLILGEVIVDEILLDSGD